MSHKVPEDAGPVSDPRNIQLVIKGSPWDKPTCEGYLPPDPDPSVASEPRRTNAGASGHSRPDPEVPDVER